MTNVTIETQGLKHNMVGDVILDASRTVISDHEFAKLIHNMVNGDLTVETFLADCDTEWLTMVIEANPNLERKLRNIIKSIEYDS